MQNVKLVRINYWVEKAETGIHFNDNVLHTDNQIRRARCWFPCMDEASQRCWYELLGSVIRSLEFCKFAIYSLYQIYLSTRDVGILVMIWSSPLPTILLLSVLEAYYTR